MSVKKRGELSNGLPPDDQSRGGDYQPRPNGLDRPTELELVDAALLGDMQAFSEIFEHHRSDLYGLCCRRLNDFALAEDAVQDIFIRALKSFPNFDRDRPVWPWFVNVAYKACIDIQRRRSFTHYSGDIAVSMDAGRTGGNGHTESALDTVIASEERAELWKSLDVLPERQRRAFVLYEVDGLSCADIAAAEGISVGAVKLLLFRARKKIRSVYQNGPLPAIVLPIPWLRWQFQRMEERIRPLLGVYNEGFVSACVQAACLSALVTMVVAANLPGVPSNGGDAVASNDAVRSSTQSRPSETAPLRTALPNIGASAKAMGDSQQTEAGSTSSLVDDMINPNQNATPENTVMYSITVSPSYENDHTILATGIHRGAFVLFASNDGGGNWKARPSRLLNGSEIVLPPDFLHDLRIFVFSYLGLQQSDDGGGIFRMVSLVQGRGIAISPSFGRKDSKILMGGKTVFEFDASTGLTQPALLTIPPGPGGGNYSYPSVAFSPGYPSDSIVFVSDDGGVSYRCKGSVCDAIQLPRSSGPLRFRFSPRCDQVGLAYAFTPWRLLVSHDGARTFEEIPFPLQYQDTFIDSRSIRDVAVLCNRPSDPAIFASARDDSSFVPHFPSGIYRSLDAGLSWDRTSIDLPGFFDSGASKLIVTPTGRLLAAGSGYGIACSIDKGQTWARRCPPEK